MKYSLFIVDGSFADFQDPAVNYIVAHSLDLDEIYNIIRLLSIRGKPGESFDFVVRLEEQ